jgi:hypothetical protein
LPTNVISKFNRAIQLHSDCETGDQRAKAIQSELSLIPIETIRLTKAGDLIKSDRLKSEIEELEIKSKAPVSFENSANPKVLADFESYLF